LPSIAHTASASTYSANAVPFNDLGSCSESHLIVKL
jgi:hypothetical protein